MTLRIFEIAEAGIRIQNPFSDEKLMLVGEIAHELGYLHPGARLLDLACGQGEMLSRWAQKYGIAGAGVDLSEAFIAAAQDRARQLGVASQVEFLAADAIQFCQSAPSYDIVSCSGASWIGGGTAGAIALMRKALRDEQRGLLLLGELFWNWEPNTQAADAMGVKADEVHTLPALYDIFSQSGVQLLNMVCTDDEGWDRYQTYHWMAIHRWAQEHPGDPESAQLALEIENWKRGYFVRRGQFGWGMFLLRVRS